MRRKNAQVVRIFARRLPANLPAILFFALLSHVAYLFFSSLRRTVSWRRLNDFEIRTAELPQFGVKRLDPGIGGYGNRPIETVVGHEHAVFLKPFENCLHFRRKAGNVKRTAQAQAFTHTRQILIGEPAGKTARGIDMSAPSSSDCYSHRMCDLATNELVVTHHGGEDRQSCGVS